MPVGVSASSDLRPRAVPLLIVISSYLPPSFHTASPGHLIRSSIATRTVGFPVLSVEYVDQENLTSGCLIFAAADLRSPDDPPRAATARADRYSAETSFAS